MYHSTLETLVVLTLLTTLVACKQEAETPPQETTTKISALETSPPDDTQEDKGKPTVEVVDNEKDTKSAPVYLASFEKDRITVSFHDVKDKERLVLGKWLTEQIEKNPSIADDVIDRDNKVIPERFREIEAYDILLPENSRTSAKVKGFHYFRGASADHLLAVLDLPENAENEAYGIARPAGTLAKEARLEPAKEHALPEDREEAFLKKTRATLAEKMLEADREKLPEALSPEHFVITEGDLPGENAYVAAIDIRLGQEVADERISGLALLDKNYEITSFIEPPNINLSHYKTTLFLDLGVEGNRSKQMIYESTYYEGHFMHLLHFTEDGKPQVVILEGDGA